MVDGIAFMTILKKKHCLFIFKRQDILLIFKQGHLKGRMAGAVTSGLT